MSEFKNDELGEERPTKKWESPLTWSMLVVAGWLLYELTAQPMLASIAICLKFGWEDFRTALWLRRIDPHRARAKACFALYAASGLWKTAITASIMFFAIAVVMAPDRNAQQGQPLGQPAPPQGPELPPTFIGAVLAAIGGHFLLALATCRALWFSFHHGVKLWLDSGMHRARRRGLWPPNGLCEGNENKAHRVLRTTVFVLVFPFLMTGIVLVASVAGPRGAAPPAWEDKLMAWGGVAVIVLVAAVILGLSEFLQKRVVALHPDDCWGTGDGDEFNVAEAAEAI